MMLITFRRVTISKIIAKFFEKIVLVITLIEYHLSPILLTHTTMVHVVEHYYIFKTLILVAAMSEKGHRITKQ